MGNNSAEHIDDEQAWPEGLEFPGVKEAFADFVPKGEADIQASEAIIAKTENPDVREYLTLQLEEEKRSFEKIKQQLEELGW